MGYLNAVSPLVQARLVLLQTRLRRHTSLLLVLAGFAGALGGGALIGTWCLGLVLIAESVLCVFVGFARDDGRPPAGEGERTVKDILRREARRR